MGKRCKPKARSKPKRKPQPKRRAQPKRKAQPKRRRPQQKKIGKCDCRALAIQKCGSRGTSRQTKCRNAYIAQCNKRCQPKRKPQPKRRKPRVPKRKPQPKKIGKCECRALAIKKCGSRGTNRQTKCRIQYIAQCEDRCQPKARPQPKRKPQTRRKPQPKKIGKCECRALAIKKCGSRGTN